MFHTTRTDKTRVTEATRTNDKIEIVDFGLVDERRRAIGMQVITYEQDLVAYTGDQPWGWWTAPVGHWFAVRFWATRNGGHYGAVQRDHYFESATDRDAFVAKYLADARKRYAKQASKA